MTFNPDDPKWTAYILGELDASEQADMDNLLDSSEDARAYMEELRVAAGALETELKADLNGEWKVGFPPVINAVHVGLTPEQRAAIQDAAGMGRAVKANGNGSNLRWFNRQQAAWAGGFAIAAMILIAVAIPSLWRLPKTDSAAQNSNLSAGAAKTDQVISLSPAIPSKEEDTKLVTPTPLQVQQNIATDRTSSKVEKAAVAASPGVPLVSSSVLNLDNRTTGVSSIDGVVHDPSQALIPGVTVTATNLATGVVFTTFSNDSGAYRFTNLPPGAYKISAALPGFQTASITNINLGTAESLRFNLAMVLGNSSTAVEVAVNAQQTLTESSASVGEVLTGDRIRALPTVGNNVLDLLEVLPGFRVSAFGNQYDTISGLGLNSVNTTINGLSTTDTRYDAQTFGFQQAGQGQGQGQQGQQGVVVGQVAGVQGGQVGRGDGGAGGGGGRAGGGGGGGRGGGAAAGGAPAAGPPPPPPAPPSVRAAPVATAAAAAPARIIPDNPTVIGGVDRPTPNSAAYATIIDNPFILVGQEPLSTFSSDVDTASYANIRRFLTQNQMPPRNAVRIEEMINYFPYDYAQPTGKDPIGARMEIASAPWNPSHRLVRIGIKARDLDSTKRPASNLVFLIDVSGSMQPQERLPLIKSGLKMLVNNLTENDHVSMVVYAGASGVVLDSTSGNRKDVINSAIDRLEAGGSTNGGAGIQMAYQLAVSHFIKGGTNRVILATDGDFNVGVTNQLDLTRLIQDNATSGVFLSVLGVGTDNLKDATMERLADTGNGVYAYLDTTKEAYKVLVEQMSGTLVNVAKDVKLQVEFNPAFVEAYRLIGYENRVLANQDFNNDRKDAGDMGAGHTVTALYELVPKGGSITGPGVDPLKYQIPAPAPVPQARNTSNETLTLKIRYKDPDGTESKLMSVPLVDGDAQFSRASVDFRFAASVAEFGMLLRDSPFRGNATSLEVLDNAQASRGTDREGYRQEFIGLVQKARQLRLD